MLLRGEGVYRPRSLKSVGKQLRFRVQGLVVSLHLRRSFEEFGQRHAPLGFHTLHDGVASSSDFSLLEFYTMGSLREILNLSARFLQLPIA